MPPPPDRQRILGGTIAPDAGAIQMNFTTLRPAKPVFTVWRSITNVQATDMVPANQIAFAGETLTPTTTHAKRIADLPQGVPLWLRIDANAEDLPAGDPRAPASRIVHTGSLVRVCLVRIFSLELLNSGDSDGGAEMLFQFQVYNGSSTSGEALISTHVAEIDSIDNGEFVRDMAGTFKVDNAPDVVVPYLGALHWNGKFPVKGRGLPPTVPAQADSGADDEAQWADCMTRVMLPSTLGTTTSSGLNMGTGLEVPSIAATLSVETIVSNPSNIRPVKLVSL
jgi:hypothetical protein